MFDCISIGYHKSSKLQNIVFFVDFNSLFGEYTVVNFLVKSLVDSANKYNENKFMYPIGKKIQN